MPSATATSTQLALLVNPISGQGKGREAADRLGAGLEKAGFRVDRFESRQAGDLRRTSAELDGRYRALVAVGGDGTVNEVIQSLKPDSPPLVISPLGTANLSAREWGFDSDIDSVVRRLRNGVPRLIDLGEHRGGDQEPRRFLACLGVGMDAEVVSRVAAARKGKISWAAYAQPIVDSLMSFRPTPLRVSIEGSPWAEGVFLVVANLRWYGGPWTVAPEASPADGLLDVVLFQGSSRLDWTRYFVALLQGEVQNDPAVRCARARSLSVEAERPVPVQIDGDPAGALPIQVRALPKQIRVLCDPTERP